MNIFRNYAWAIASLSFFYQIGFAQDLRKAMVLHRTVVSCNGNQVSQEQVLSLASGTYTNYTCGNRYKEQCIDDGTYNSFYMEWCEYENPVCKPTKVHRDVFRCTGAKTSSNQIIDLNDGYTNYTCGNRFQEQCLDDGSFDGYYVEWCEYSCDPGSAPR